MSSFLNLINFYLFLYLFFQPGDESVSLKESQKFVVAFFQRHKKQRRWEETKAKNQHDLVGEKQIFYFTQLMLGRIRFNLRLRRNRKEKEKLSLMQKWVTTNQLPSGFFVLFYTKYLEPHCCGLEAVSRFTPAYVESTRSRAHHPTCPRIEIPGDWCLLRHISPSCWAWLTATVWSQLMNSNRRLPFVIAWFTSNVDNEQYFGAQFCHGSPISSNTLSPCSNRAGVLSHHLGFITTQSPFQ